MAILKDHTLPTGHAVGYWRLTGLTVRIDQAYQPRVRIEISGFPTFEASESGAQPSTKRTITLVGENALQLGLAPIPQEAENFYELVAAIAYDVALSQTVEVLDENEEPVEVPGFFGDGLLWEPSA